MSYCGFVITVDKLKKHPNADKLQLLTVFGTDVCVGLDVAVGDIGIYFPCDGQLTARFCEENHLCTHNLNGEKDSGYMDPKKRNIKAIKLRGEKSDGLFVPLKAIAYTGVNLNEIKVGDRITELNGHEICRKYIPPTNVKVGHVSEGNSTRKTKVLSAPLFAEHADTEQLAYNLGAFKSGDEVEITLKMHGTSQRTGYLPVLVGYKDSLYRRFVNKLIMGLKVRKNWGSNGRNALYHSLKHGEPIYDWGGVSGTRRVVLEDYNGGFYGSNEFREQHSKVFDGKLMKGETVYYEVVGFTTTGQPIMSSASNSKMQDKEFIKQYGEETVFSYGCKPNPKNLVIADPNANEVVGIKIPLAPQSDIYVYRMTMTNEDGFVVEYTPDFMRYRCEQMGVKTVPVLWKGIIPEIDNDESLPENMRTTVGDWIKNVAEQYYDGPDPIGKTHIREGAVVRIINRPKFCAYKHKNFAFKVLEGLIKESALAPDMEEAQEATNE
jgi:hypothetical protein